MLGPMMGPVGSDEMAPPPSEVKEKFYKWWWAYLAVLVLSGIGEILCKDVFGVLLVVLISFIVWYMVKDDCVRMSQCYVFMFGFMCAIQAVFDSITLLISVGGRRTRHVSRKPLDETRMSYTTVIETRPFFDKSEGFTYNAQSWMMIISLVVMLLGLLLATWTYKAFPGSVFRDALNEADPMFQGNTRRPGQHPALGADRTPGAGYGGSAQGPGLAASNGGRPRPGGMMPNRTGTETGTGGAARPPPVFQGHCQRLGDKSTA